jgi:hypothetical protein
VVTKAITLVFVSVTVTNGFHLDETISISYASFSVEFYGVVFKIFMSYKTK